METKKDSSSAGETTSKRILRLIGIIVGTNLLLVLSMIPIVTAGAGFVAAHFTFLNLLRGDKNLNPAKTFWMGFKMGFKQATIVWIVAVILGVFLVLDGYWCFQLSGFFQVLAVIFVIFALFLAVIALYIFPTMAAFQGSYTNLVYNSMLFAFKKPLHMIIILFFSIIPALITIRNLQWLPVLIPFWVLCGCSLVAFLTDYLVLQSYSPYLPDVSEEEK